MCLRLLVTLLYQPVTLPYIDICISNLSATAAKGNEQCLVKPGINCAAAFFFFYRGTQFSKYSALTYMLTVA